MPNYIEMPKLSDTMTEGTLLKWLRKVGDKVQVGDVLAEVETDKATMEMESFEDGTLGEIYVEEGRKVAVGEKVGVLLKDGESAPQKNGNGSSSQAVTLETTAGPKPAEGSEKSAEAPSERVKASPLAKKVALENKVDLSTIKGTGPGGRIIEKDVTAAATSAGEPKSVPAAPKEQPKSAPSTALPSAETTRIPLSGMRKVIAERLVTSKTTIPHFYLGMEVDAAPILALRAALNVALEAAGQAKLTINDFVLKSVAAAVARNLKINSSWDGDAIIENSSVDISVAVAIEDGLITPVVRNAQAKTLSQISMEMKDLASRARSKKLKPEEYQGGTITVSSLGPFGIESFYAIVNPPQAAILAIGSIIKKPVVGSKGEIVASERMTIGFSGDHRVIDGAIGAAFLVDLRKYLEQPALALV